MSKTYTLSATRYTGFKNHDYSWGTYWGSVEYTNRYTGRVCRCNDYGQDYFFTILMFNNSTLATLRTKTVTSITLAMTFSDTDANGDIAVRFKYNSSTSEFSTANQAQTGYGTYNVLTSTANSSSKSWNITSSGVPVYGFVVGPDGTTTLSNWITISSATLTIVTNENDYSYTLAYNTNGGSGTPSNQTGSNSQGSPSYTFTISSTVPTRSGYSFQGWSTSSSATTASYYPGGTITVTSAGTTTLYAVWAQNASVTLIYSTNGGVGGPGVVTATTPDSSYTFNISYSVPTKTGFECLGWATTSNSSTASYTGGDTITVSVSTPIILYAVWRPINTVRMVNRIGTKLKTYKIYVIDNNNTLIPHYAMIVNEDGVSLENYF